MYQGKIGANDVREPVSSMIACRSISADFAQPCAYVRVHIRHRHSTTANLSPLRQRFVDQKLMHGAYEDRMIVVASRSQHPARRTHTPHTCKKASTAVSHSCRLRCTCCTAQRANNCKPGFVLCWMTGFRSVANDAQHRCAGLSVFPAG